MEGAPRGEGSRGHIQIEGTQHGHPPLGATGAPLPTPPHAATVPASCRTTLGGIHPGHPHRHPVPTSP